MAVMAPPDVVEEINLLESLEFDLPCEYKRKVWSDGCPRSADWIVWVSCPTEGCEVKIRNFCNQCLQHRNAQTLVVCLDCAMVVPPLSTLLRAERIKEVGS